MTDIYLKLFKHETFWCIPKCPIFAHRLRDISPTPILTILINCLFVNGFLQKRFNHVTCGRRKCCNKNLLLFSLFYCNILTSHQSRNRCIRSKISGYNLDCGRFELGADATLTGSRWMSNNDTTRCDRKFRELESVSWR